MHVIKIEQFVLILILLAIMMIFFKSEVLKSGMKFELGRVRTSFFSSVKTNCHRNYGKVFAFTHSNEKC